MMHTPPNPRIFERLRVTDGLPIDAELWQLAHSYHQQRQNLHYQSLQKPGIVCGLGVAVVDPPDEISSRYRDNRWILLQPGIAIDLWGNPIVVPEPMHFRISFQPSAPEPVTVYIVLRYVDPELLESPTPSNRVRETFRIDEIVRQPAEGEVEVCRVLLSPDTIRLAAASDAFAPGQNQLDLRFRNPVGARPLGVVRVAVLAGAEGTDPEFLNSINALLQSLQALFPTLQGSPLQLLQLSAPASNPWDFDLVCAEHTQLTSLSPAMQETIRQFLASGGVLLASVASSETTIDELSDVEFKLEKAIAETATREDIDDVREEMKAELLELQANLEQRVLELRRDFERHMDVPLSQDPYDSGQIGRAHPLRNQPFAFGQFPPVGNRATQICHWQGVVLAIGDLASAWRPDAAFNYPRETIRAAQELGINILHFAWRRRQLMQLQQSSPAAADRSPPR